MTKTVLVTGAAGFLGRNVARQLREQKAEIHAIFNSPPVLEDRMGLASWQSGGVTMETLEKLPAGIQCIYHCAGSGSVAHSLSHPNQDFQNNVCITQMVLDYARRQKDVSVILPSSAGIYGAADILPISIDTPQRPVSPYGMNKLMGEMLARQYATYFDVPVAIVRLFSIYGPELRKQLLWDACNKLIKGEASFFGTGAETRDWLHVTDATTLLLKAAEIASTTAPTLNGGSGESVSIKTTVSGLAQRLGNNHNIQFNGVTRAGDPQHYAADIREALALDWQPQISFESGLDEYVAWFNSITSPASGN